jgi:hypothetical protein
MHPQTPPQGFKYYELVMAAFVTVLLCSNLIGVSKVATVGGNQVMTLTLPVRAVASFSPSSGDPVSALIDGIYYRIEGDVSLSTFADTITEVTGGDATTIQTGLPALTATGAPGWTYRTFRHSGTVLTTPKAFLRAKASETP